MPNNGDLKSNLLPQVDPRGTPCGKRHGASRVDREHPFRTSRLWLQANPSSSASKGKTREWKAHPASHEKVLASLMLATNDENARRKSWDQIILSKSD